MESRRDFTCHQDSSYNGNRERQLSTEVVRSCLRATPDTCSALSQQRATLNPITLPLWGGHTARDANIKVAANFQNKNCSTADLPAPGEWRRAEIHDRCQAGGWVRYGQGSNTPVASGTQELTSTPVFLFAAGDVLKLIWLPAEYSLDQKILINLTCKMHAV